MPERRYARDLAGAGAAGGVALPGPARRRARIRRRARARATPGAAARDAARAHSRPHRARRRREARRAAADHHTPPERSLPSRRGRLRSEAGSKGCSSSPSITRGGARRCSSRRRTVRGTRGEAGGQRDPLAVGRRRPARATPRAVGVPRRAPLPHADRERRVRWLPRLLSAGGAAPVDTRGRGDRRTGRADRARQPANHPPARRR